MFCAAVVACLLVLQGLLPIKSSLATPVEADVFFDAHGAAITRVICLNNAGQDAPVHKHADDSDCCLSCSANASDESWLLTAIVAIVASFMGSGLGVSLYTGFAEVSSLLTGTGWGSVWAARAPPIG